MFKKDFSLKVLVVVFFLASLSVLVSGHLVLESQMGTDSDRLYPVNHYLGRDILTIDSNYVAIANDGGAKMKLFNTGTRDLFVPLKTNAEWLLFQSAAYNLGVVARNYYCGDNQCSINYTTAMGYVWEDTCSCPSDCPGVCSVCGDGSCNGSETYSSCVADCTICGDSHCSGAESMYSCPVDCSVCGDGYCMGNETVTSCNYDCSYCGDGVCGIDAVSSAPTRWAENPSICPQDCPDVCGDTWCSGNETSLDCPTDCTVCGDHHCTGSETATNCPGDCTVCGDGICSGGETFTICPADCSVCGDGYCTGSENSTNCNIDCVALPPDSCVTNNDCRILNWVCFRGTCKYLEPAP